MKHADNQTDTISSIRFILFTSCKERLHMSGIILRKGFFLPLGSTCPCCCYWRDDTMEGRVLATQNNYYKDEVLRYSSTWCYVASLCPAQILFTPLLG